MSRGTGRLHVGEDDDEYGDDDDDDDVVIFPKWLIKVPVRLAYDMTINKS
jgi:hypothetical protein